MPGIEVLLRDSLSLLRGRRVGLITNQSGRDRRRRSDIDLLYHAPGIYRVKDSKPKLTTKGECWYFRPDRGIKKGQRMTIERVYDAPEEVALEAKGFSPLTDRARDPERPYNTKIRVRN